MLKLRKVEIIGFKSFCERTVVTFSGIGTTCIVGPNGCGKSNVVDAISWVLGEQSHKSLRAERMADCIFNGTVKRPPMGLAEVTITLEDPELAEAARFVFEGAAAAEANGERHPAIDGRLHQIGAERDHRNFVTAIAAWRGWPRHRKQTHSAAEIIRESPAEAVGGAGVSEGEAARRRVRTSWRWRPSPAKWWSAGGCTGPGRASI